MTSFYSNGKLLITAEYAVLGGAKALAVPCKKGQTLRFKESLDSVLHWNSYDEKGSCWFEARFELPELKIIHTSNSDISNRLQDILIFSKKENPSFLNQGGTVETELEFNRQWGLGSSATLIVNIASWAKINSYTLLENSFGGSGYDVACGLAEGPIFFTKKKNTPWVTPVAFSPSFRSELFFVYLNQKRDSQEAVQNFDVSRVTPQLILSLNQLTEAISESSTLEEFNVLIQKHENLIGGLLQQKTIKEQLFSDYSGSIKSLGAWGGDFIMATGGKETQDYFSKKGYQTIIPFNQMCKLY
jgi:mevalonate kinase